MVDLERSWIPQPLEGHQKDTPREERFFAFFEQQIEKYTPSNEFLQDFGYCFNGSITFVATPEIPQIPMLRSLVFWALQELQLDEDEASDLMLAFEEALANVVRHAYPAEDSKWIRLQLRREGSDLYIELWDRGALGREPELCDLINKERPQGRPPLKRRGGMGLYLMHRLLTQVVYQIGPEENLLTMVKQMDASS